MFERIYACRHHCSGENLGEKIKYKIELSANTVDFISCRLLVVFHLFTELFLLHSSLILNIFFW